MTERKILNSLFNNYPALIDPGYPFPAPFQGSGQIKAIILGADPTHIVNGKSLRLKMVFGLDKEKSGEKSPYWNSMRMNLQQVGLQLENIYVQNVCRNYFVKETSKNKEWVEIARKYWIPFLKEELDNLFNPAIPVLMTAQYILHAMLKDPKRKINASEIYNKCLVIPQEDNLLARELLAFYRHPYYSLKHWKEYGEFITHKIN